VTAKRRYLGGVSKFLGFLLGVAVALAGPAVFGVLAAPGGIELNTKEMALAFGIGALIFWAVVSYFSGAGALGAFVAFGTVIYCWLWIPNRTTNFLNDVPGVTNGMIEGSKQYTLNGVVPILTVISLVYAIQLIVHSVQRRRRERAEAERVQREQEAAQAQQEADAAALYPVAGSTYPAESGGYAGSFGNSTRYDDLFDEDPEPVRPRNQADEQTSQLPVSAPEQTAPFSRVDADNDAQGNYTGDDTVLVPTDRDETTQVPVESPQAQAAAPTPPQPPAEADEPTVAAPVSAQEPAQPTSQAEEQPVATAPVETEQEAGVAGVKQPVAAAPVEADQQPTAAAPVEAGEQRPTQQVDEQTIAAPAAPSEQPTAAAPVAADEQPTVAAPTKASGQPTPPASGADEDVTVVAPASEQGKKDVDGAQQAAAPATGGKEQMGQQYRERMDDPEDTGELYISAFENPAQVSIRPAGA
jgi:heme exporter protein D